LLREAKKQSKRTDMGEKKRLLIFAMRTAHDVKKKKTLKVLITEKLTCLG
jgi:hypothetical protein